jgi:hypothetical protein
MESKSVCDAILGSEFFDESGFLSIAPAGSRVGVGLRDICAEYRQHERKNKGQEQKSFRQTMT